jgi:UDP-N-acetylglucosamine/UDP-N-acetylgalactosamine diphosphorylase
MTRDPSGLIEAFRRAGQGHVFAFYEQLSAEDQGAPSSPRPARSTWPRWTGWCARSSSGAGPAGRGPWRASGRRPSSALRRRGDATPGREGGRRKRRCRAGRVAAFTVAGGQGTRLGYDGPKGTFPGDPGAGPAPLPGLRGKIAGRGPALRAPLHWFIMTSHQNHAATEAFFARTGTSASTAAGPFLPAGPDAGGRLFEGKILLEAPRARSRFPPTGTAARSGPSTAAAPWTCWPPRASTR